MSATKLLIAVAVLAVLAGAVFYSNRQEDKKLTEPAKDAAPALITITPKDLKRVELHRKDADTLILTKDDSGKWTMVEPQPWPVDQSQGANIEAGFTGLSWDRLIEEKAGDLGQYGLASPTLRVTGIAKDGKRQTLLIGRDTPIGGSTYAKLENDPRVFTIAAPTKGYFDRQPIDFRDKRLVVFDSDKIGKIEVTVKGASFEFGRNGQSEWQMVKPGPYRADGFQVEELIRRAKEAQMDSSAEKDTIAKQTRSWPSYTQAATIKITDNTGTHQLDVRKSGSDYYAKGNAAEGVYKLTADAGTALTRGMDEYRNKKLFDFGFTDLSRIEVRTDTKTYSFQKSGEKWQAAGKEMDSVGIQSLIDKLRDLSATEFSTKPFGATKLAITAVTADGKRTEKVHIASDGDEPYAQRENEPTVYRVPATSVREIENAAADVKPAAAAAKK